jgi:hypothetical protein
MRADIFRPSRRPLLGLQRLARGLARLVRLDELKQERHMGGLPFRMAFFTICCATISPWLRFTVLPPIRATTVLQNSRIRISPKLARSFGPLDR